MKMKNKTLPKYSSILMVLALFIVGVTFLYTQNLSVATTDNTIINETGSKVLNQLINNGKPSILIFTSPYCRDCVSVKKYLNKMEAKHSKQINFLTIDIKKDSPLNKEALKRFKILGVPQVAFLTKEGSENKVIKGLYPEDEYKKQLELIVNN